MAKFFLLISLFPIFLGSSAFASPLPRTPKPCRTTACENSHPSRRILDPSEISVDLKNRLQLKAEELAGIWGDTILEGDYYAEEQVTLDQVEEITRAGTLEAYRVTYSSKAWDTSSCNFDYADLSTLSSCETGRIVESGFISADFKSLTRDPNSLATFQKD